ncbi:MAG: hypothetical protein DSY50_08775 [Desulfobulbus sp.]|nr:MAG: hypothetical protein DSY50_08775 [Desulfobulbus sp.]
MYCYSVLQAEQGHYLVRWNIGRDHFTVEPGLYAAGSPDADSTVFVGANYKMSFDLLRQTLTGRNGWRNCSANPIF